MTLEATIKYEVKKPFPINIAGNVYPVIAIRRTQPGELLKLDSIIDGHIWFITEAGERCTYTGNENRLVSMLTGGLIEEKAVNVPRSVR